MNVLRILPNEIFRGLPECSDSSRELVYGNGKPIHLVLIREHKERVVIDIAKELDSGSSKARNLN